MNDPNLRADSYTALLLEYLTPQAMNLESRVLFLGNIPYDSIQKTREHWRQHLGEFIQGQAGENDNSINTEEPTLGPMPFARERVDGYGTGETSWASALSTFNEIPGAGKHVSHHRILDPRHNLRSPIKLHHRKPEPIPAASVTQNLHQQDVHKAIDEESVSRSRNISPQASNDSSGTSYDPHVLFRGRFLVQVRHRESHPRPPLPTSNVMRESSGPRTRLVVRWKEHVVVARRRDTKLVIKLYATRNADKLDKEIAQRAESRPQESHMAFRRPTWKLIVDSSWSLSVYSCSDLTMALWGPAPHHKQVYIFQTHSAAQKLAWARLLAAATHLQHPDDPLTVHVASSGCDVRFPPNWFYSVDKGNPSNRPATATDHVNYGDPARGWGWMYRELLNNTIHLSKGIRQKENKPPDLLGSFCKPGIAWQHHRTGVVWWPESHICEQAVAVRPLLEPEWRLVVLPALPTATPDEPFPVEGFCHRVTSWMGVWKRQGHHAAEYLHTHGQLLFYTRSNSAEPPPVTPGNNQVESVVEPFALSEDSRHIAWLESCQNARDFNWHDALAVIERDRRARLIETANGVVDLALLHAIEACPDIETDFLVVGAREGGKVRLRLDSRPTRDAWVRRLNDLRNYWTRKNHKEALLKWAIPGNEPPEVTPLIKNRSVIVSGFIYHKRHKFASFRRFFAVLTRTALHLYAVERGVNPVALQRDLFTVWSQLRFRHKISYKLAEGCYVYSGQLAEDLLLAADNYVDPGNPGVLALPRAFEDGTIAQDTEEQRIFVLWYKEPHTTPGSILHRSGRPVVFLGRSAADRYTWVSALQHAIAT